ncbi:MAG: hypothetical protein FWH05_06315 [Oscillospiraceae bacterium]|nr:hypothetical protein [Oscillospiraceae bacterium]
MKIFELKTKLSSVLLKVLCFIIAAAIVVFLVFSLIFSFGSNAPSIFGRNIFLVKTDHFSNLVADDENDGKISVVKGEAVISEKVDFSEIQPGNMVIFQNSERLAGLAVILTADRAEGVHSFTAESDHGRSIILSESQIVGKVLRQNKAMGLIIGFAMSPAGVLVIAILPCLMIVVFEFYRVISSKREEKESVRPIKKQDEIPTFVPRKKSAAVIDAYSKTLPPQDDYDMEEELRRKEPPVKASELMGVADEDAPFFGAGGRARPIAPSAPKPPPPPPVKPVVSQKRLNEVIAQTNKELLRKKEILDSVKPKSTPTAPVLAHEPDVPAVITPAPVFVKEKETPPENKLEKERLFAAPSTPPVSPPPAPKTPTPMPTREPVATPKTHIPSAYAGVAAHPADELINKLFDKSEKPVVPSLAAEKTTELESVKVFTPDADNVKVFPASNTERSRRFSPRTRTPSAKAIPSLDQLLSAEPEPENAKYNIEDILNSLEKKREDNP